MSITGSEDGDRKTEVNAKAKEPREIENAPLNAITEPAAATAITGAHVGDTEVVPNEGYDYDYWAWNELPPMPSEPPLPTKPSTASAPELKGQEPTVDNGDNLLLEIATIGDSITRILKSASDSSTHTPALTSAPTSALTSTLTSALTPALTLTTITSTPTRAIWGPKPNLSLSSSSFSSTFSSTFSPSSPIPPKRFQRSPFFGKKIGVTPRVSRIPSVSGALDPGTPTFESPTGPIMVAGSEKEPEGHSEDEGSSLIGPKEGGFETFGGENGGRPFVAILADLREILGHRSCKPDGLLLIFPTSFY